MKSTIIPIVGYGSQILRESTIEASDSTDSKQVMQSLLDSMKHLHTAVGLAAPQINSNLSIFVMQLGGKNTLVINPRIIKRRDTQQSVESCMSIPGLSGTVIRDVRIEVEFFDAQFSRQRMKLSGFDAVVFQHEYDHLNGIMYTDRMSRHGLQAIAERLSELEKGSVKTYYDMIFFGPTEPVTTTPIEMPAGILAAGNNTYGQHLGRA